MLGLSPFISSLINTMEGNGPQGDNVLSIVSQSPTVTVGNSSHFSNVQLRDLCQWTTELSSVVYVRRSEVLERNYGGFPLVDPLGVVPSHVSYMGMRYNETV